MGIKRYSQYISQLKIQIQKLDEVKLDLLLCF